MLLIESGRRLFLDRLELLFGLLYCRNWLRRFTPLRKWSIALLEWSVLRGARLDSGIEPLQRGYEDIEPVEGDDVGRSLDPEVEGRTPEDLHRPDHLLLCRHSRHLPTFRRAKRQP